MVHAGQALPGDQVKVELILLVQSQLLHHLGKEGGVLLVVAACAILLQRTRSSDCTHALLSATVQCAASCHVALLMTMIFNTSLLIPTTIMTLISANWQQD